MVKKVSKRNIPRKKVKRSNKKKEKELKKKAVKIIKQRQLINLGLSLILIFLILSTTIMLYLNSVDIKINESSPFLVKKAVEINNFFFPKPPELVAVVNQEPLTILELDERYALIPEEYKQFISREEVLSQMVDEKLLLQEAATQGFTATEKEINERINALLLENGISIEELEESINNRGLELQDLKDFYAKEILLTKLINSTIMNQIEISDVDVKDYYFRNQEQFTIPESVNVSHILICHNESIRCVSNLTKEEALEKAGDVTLLITETNFAELALEHSDEPAAQITKGSLGWVSIQDPFDKTFLNYTFKLDKGEVSEPIETEFGYHLIKVFDKREAQVIELDVVYDQINQTLSLQQETDLFGEYVEELRDGSDIVIYLNNEN